MSNWGRSSGWAASRWHFLGAALGAGMLGSSRLCRQMDLELTSWPIAEGHNNRALMLVIVFQIPFKVLVSMILLAVCPNIEVSLVIAGGRGVQEGDSR